MYSTDLRVIREPAMWIARAKASLIEKCKCKGPEAGACQVCLKNSSKKDM